MFWIGLLFGLLGYGAYVSSKCFFRVDQGYLAVLVSFGAAVKEAAGSGHLRTLGPGLHFKMPWQKVHRVAMMEQSLDLSGEEGGRTAMAEDGTVLRFDSILRFVPEKAELEQFLFDLKAPREHITGLFTCLLRNEIANFSEALPGENGRSGMPDPAEGGSYALIRRERKQLNARIEEFCRAQIGKQYGVQFSAVDLTDILPPDELADALNAVMNAHAEADALYSRAEADAHHRIVAAEQGVEIAKASGRAVEEEIHTLAEFLDDLRRQGTLPSYVARRRTEVLSQSRTLFLRSVS